MQEQNWFSAPSALRVYGQYLNLDKDHNGMLNKEELAGYGTGTLTGVFLDRVFQECLTYDGEMDYKTYLDFVLALENRHEPQSLHYLFRILDINSQGYLTAFNLNYFFRVSFKIIFKKIKLIFLCQNLVLKKTHFIDCSFDIFRLFKNNLYPMVPSLLFLKILKMKYLIW